MITQPKRGRFQAAEPRHNHSTRRAASRTRGSGFVGFVSLVLTLGIVCGMLLYGGSRSQSLAVRVSVPDIPARFNAAVDSAVYRPAAAVQPAVEEVQTAAPEVIQAEPMPSRKHYQLNDSDLVAPVPNADGYGQVQTAAELSWLPEKAAALLDGQKLYFGPEREILDWGGIRYYLDDSIAVVTWKEACGNNVLTFAEVKIADGSQFRRFLAGGQFGADTQYYTTEMAKSVNAVLASSGDFYKFRYNGVVVYEGNVRRVNTNKADTCYINDAGDLLFTSQNSVMTQAEAQAFVDENHIRFSLTFGPVLVDNGEPCLPQSYDLGEIYQASPRAALLQMDKLHYIVITSNAEGEYTGHLTMPQFAERINQIGCRKAYALDGGQTAAIALDGELVNKVLYGQQRSISDIIYFATAVTEGG